MVPPPAHLRIRPRRGSAFLGAALLLGLGATATADAAHSNHLRVYSGENGLSQLSVKCAAQAADGALWFGTWSGLNRFDGQRFESFSYDDGMPHSRINALATDAKGQLWVGTHAGLARYSGEGFVPVTEPGRLGDDEIHALYFGPDETLWIGTRTGLLAWRDGRVLPTSDELRGPIAQACVDRAGRVWVAAENGLWRSIAPHDGSRFEQLHASNWVRTLVSLPDGRVAGGGSLGMEIFEDGAPPFLVQTDDLGRASRIRSLTVGLDGTLYAGGYDGLLELRGTDLVSVHRGIEDTSVRILDVLLVDREGSMWMGGFGGILHLPGLAFSTHDQSSGLPSSNVRPVLRGPEGDLWVGTLAGVARYDGVRWHTYGREEGLRNELTLSLLLDSRQRLWVGHHGGLDRLEGDHFVASAAWPTGVPIHHVAEDPRGQVWAISSNRGLWVFDAAGTTATPMPFPGDAGTACRILRARNGDMWLSSYAGLCRYRDGQWTVFTPADGLVAPEPYFIAEDHDGAIWFSYQAAAGVTRFDGTDFRTYTTADGLAHDSVYSIGCDAKGQMWFGSARGVDRFDGVQFRNYTPGDGYASFESNSGGFWEDPDGTLWFGTARGLSEYHPARDRALDAPLRLDIASLRVGGVAIDRPVRLPRSTNQLVARVNVLSSVNPAAIEVQTRIAGLENEWQEAKRGDIRLPNLPAGRFSFEVRARRYTEPWTTLRSENFEILRVFWQRWPFLLAMAVSLVALVVLIVRSKTRQVRLANLQLQQAVALRTRELLRANEELADANRAKSAFMASVSHEIRTPMNAILGMTELVLDSPLRDEQRERLTMAQASGEHLLQLINDILDISRIEAGRLELAPQPVQLHVLVRTVIAELADAAHRKGLRLEYAIDHSAPQIVIVDELRLRQILINLIGNALKFTAVGHVIVQVRGPRETLPTDGESIQKTRLEFEVRDSGIGIAAGRLEAIFESFTQEDSSTTRHFGGTGLGLSITRQLAALMNGQVRVESEQGRGSCFSVDIEVELPTGAIAPQRAGWLAAKRVLLAEADPRCAEAIAQKFRAQQSEVRCAASGEGLLRLTSQDDAGDLVLVDPKLPGARRALDHLQGNLATVLLLTATGDASEPDLRSHPAVDAIVMRPVSMEQIESLGTAGATPRADSSTPARSGPTAPSRRSLRVLVAEDDLVNQKLAVAMLERLGHVAVVADDGELAVAAFERESVDVVLMDMQMPNLDGLDATRAIRRIEQRRGGHVPVIALTANAMIGDRERCLEAGMDDYLSKPIRRAALDQALQKADRTSSRQPRPA